MSDFSTGDFQPPTPDEFDFRSASEFTDSGKDIEELQGGDPIGDAKSRSFNFEGLTLWEALELWLFHPVRVTRELIRIILKTDQQPPSGGESEWPEDDEAWLNDTSPMIAPQHGALSVPPWLARLGQYFRLDYEAAIIAGLLLLAIVFAFIGSGVLREAALDPLKKAQGDLGNSTFWLFMAGLLVLGIAGWGFWRGWSGRRQQELTSSEIEVSDTSEVAEAIAPVDEGIEREGDVVAQLVAWGERHAIRIGMLPVATILSMLTYRQNLTTNLSGEITGIIFTARGFITWMLSILVWYLVFAVDLNGVYRRIVRDGQSAVQALGWRRPAFRWRWAHVALLGIVCVAAYFRLNDLGAIPPEMTSDHIEKLIDATKVENGIYAVFFPNNGGREGFQMYAVAAIADWGGVGFNFHALKYATVIEGLLTVLLSFGVAKAVIGRDDEDREQLSDWVGLSMAALIAISSWHTMLSRLGLRIVLTPLTALLVIFFLVRAIRHQRRADFIYLGLVLGFGTYFYQANRMLPAVVGLSVVLAILFHSRGRLAIIQNYTVSLLMAGVIAIAVYVPMYRYSQEFPREFWNRTYGRMFGDRSFDCVDAESGRLDFCQPSIREMFDLLQERRYGPDLAQTGFEAIQENYEDALVSYMYEGDGQWISNGGGYPALDSRTAGLYMLGILLWLMLMIQRRDAALAVIPLGVLVMLLPSALAIAPGLNENPSFTRTSGTLPFAFMMAALPLGMLGHQVVVAGYMRRVYYAVAVLLVAWLLYGAAGANYDAYFDTYRTGYEQSWRPYNQIAAPLKEFADGRGSFGNAFYVNQAHWLDHRILGSSAGDLFWPNGLVQAEDVYQRMQLNQGTSYAYDPTQPLLFYVHLEDTGSREFLEQNFPGGQIREIVAARGNNFYVYEVPAGWDWLAARITAETARLGCIINCVPGP